MDTNEGEELKKDIWCSAPPEYEDWVENVVFKIINAYINRGEIKNETF